jgi:hypothetical protein
MLICGLFNGEDDGNAVSETGLFSQDQCSFWLKLKEIGMIQAVD